MTKIVFIVFFSFFFIDDVDAMNKTQLAISDLDKSLILHLSGFAIGLSFLLGFMTGHSDFM